MSVNNDVTILELKNLYRAQLKDEIAADQIRLFAMGKDLTNDLFLYSYGVKDGLTLMGMIRK